MSFTYVVCSLFQYAGVALYSQYVGLWCCADERHGESVAVAATHSIIWACKKVLTYHELDRGVASANALSSLALCREQ